MLVDIPLLDTQLNLNYKNTISATAPINIIKLREILSFESLQYLHLFNFYGIWIQTSGLSDHVIQSKTYAISIEDILLFKEQNSHRLIHAQELEGYLLIFSHAFYETFKEGLNMADFSFYNESIDAVPMHRVSMVQREQLVKILDTIYYEFTNYKNTEILWAYVHALLLNLERMLSDGHLHFPNHSKDLTHQFELLIKKWYKKHLPVSAYADALNISPNYLNQLCKKNFGKNAKKLIDDRLLVEAKRALFSGNLSISEIAFKLNFKDASYFSRFFKKQTGKTPETFKNKHILE
mgnify:CR=1 FL=1